MAHDIDDTRSRYEAHEAFPDECVRRLFASNDVHRGLPRRQGGLDTNYQHAAHLGFCVVGPTGANRRRAAATTRV